MSLTRAPLIPALLDAACEPYRSAGRFAYHFARGKLRADPVYRAILELGDVHQGLRAQFPNVATLVMHVYFPQTVVGTEFTAGVDANEFAAVDRWLDELQARVAAGRPRRDDGPVILDELNNAIALTRLACRDAQARLAGDGTLGSVPEPVRRALAADLDEIATRHRELWLARNRPGGLADSLSWLDNLRLAYDTGNPDPRWGSW